MAYQYILSEHKDGIAHITINRPQQLNALNKITIEELNDAIIKADRDIALKCILLTGSGTKAFVAGADIKEFADFNVEEGANLARDGQYLLFDLLDNLSTPSIAAVNGFALGGGLELAMACHMRVASSNAKMGLPEVSLGVIPGYGGTQRLRELVGKGKALELITTAGMLSAEEALSCGLVNHVCEQEELIAFCEKIASRICKNSSVAIAQAIKSVNAGCNDEGYSVEIEAFGACFGTDDFKEGTRAFIEKRKAQFTGK
jgi:enoyl-CoA hydratase